jgi:Amidohydrolase
MPLLALQRFTIQALANKMPINLRNVLSAFHNPVLRLGQRDAHEQCIRFRRFNYGLPAAAITFDCIAPNQEFALDCNPGAQLLPTAENRFVAAWDYEQNRRIVLDALAIFGIERSMFASNFPVAGLRINYDVLVRAMKRMLAHLSVEDQERFFWRNACTFYRLAC